jgi:hypothetical protein
MDEDAPMSIIVATMAPLFVAGAIVVVSAHFKLFPLFALILAGVVLVLGIVLAIRWMFRHFGKRRNYELGYLGEREVAENLEPLLAEGYAIFHDMPCEGVRKDFNIDHVVVGPTGLFAIETKTRRKGRGREGFKEHEVVYDGRKLIWPWAEEDFALVQAQNAAEWLTKWVHKMTGKAIVAKPVLALPGWYVTTKAMGPVSVQNARNLPSNIRGKGKPVLTNDDIDLIRRQLDNLCRDVED